jgi:hypothetical protein
VGREPRLVRIRDTLHLDQFWVSSSLLDEVERDPHLHVLSDPAPPPFDGEGNLTGLDAEEAEIPVAASARGDAW